MKLSPIVIFFLFAQFLSAQIQDKVDFVRADVLIEPTPSENRISGKVAYQFKVIEDVDSIFLDAVNIDFSMVSLDGIKTDYDYNGKKITIKKEMKMRENHIVSID